MSDLAVEVSILHVGIIFAACVAMLFLLVICRTIVNIVIIDICILGDCSAWRKLCCCFCTLREGWIRVRDRRSGGEDGDNNNEEDNEEEELEEGNLMNGNQNGLWSEDDIKDNPVKYIYSVSKKRREMFLGNIIDSEILREDKYLDSNTTSTSQQEEIIRIEKNLIARKDMDEVPFCSICLQGMESGDAFSITKACSHTFHSTCITQWINSVKSNLNCPVCREQLVSNERILKCISDPFCLEILDKND